MAFTKQTVEDNTAAVKSLTGARSLQDVMDLQTGFAKSMMSAYIAQVNASTAIVTAAMKDSIKPLNERATTMMEAVQSKK